MIHRRQQTGRRASRRGFTLVELLLVVSIILLLAGAVIISFDAVTKSSQLDEGATQLEALFRFARAEAASTGRPVRVVLAGSSEISTSMSTGTVAVASGSTNAPVEGTNGAGGLGGVALHWEPDPLGAPGRFEQVRSAAPLVGQINELIRVVPADAPTNAAALPGGESDFARELAGGPETGPAPVMFYPDGSSDNAELVLMARDEEDPRRMIVRLSGMTGVLQRHLIAPDDEATAPVEPPQPVPVDPVTGPAGK
jgi:prepilin-type N-terminal cleavage/methylation domain-containing protein